MSSMIPLAIAPAASQVLVLMARTFASAAAAQDIQIER
jgi:hypothetical protein